MLVNANKSVAKHRREYNQQKAKVEQAYKDVKVAQAKQAKEMQVLVEKEDELKVALKGQEGCQRDVDGATLLSAMSPGFTPNDDPTLLKDDPFASKWSTPKKENGTAVLGSPNPGQKTIPETRPFHVTTPKTAGGNVANPYAKAGAGWTDQEGAEQVAKYESDLAAAMLNSLTDTGPCCAEIDVDGDKKPAAKKDGETGYMV